MKINTISISDYPARLRDMPGIPDRLWYRGTLPDDSRPVVTIVGTRRPTSYGRIITEQLATRLVERGVVIASGLALGVDGIAHQAALKAGGTTVAVLASGVDIPTPNSHRQLAEDIVASGGALISSFPPGTHPMKFRFLERNWLETALSDSMIVTEATTRSGTMNTVSHALSQGRDVYAVPGSILSPMSGGCNQLILTGASPIIDIDEWVEQHFPRKANKVAPLIAFTTEEQTIIDLLALGIADGDELHTKSGLETAAYLQTITMLEITGAVRPLGNNQWSL